ncbi:MAG TPA: hypothetical protein VGQ83_26310 [Polyangia bacterium]|jgi:multimeric flavodoxin WrbA
MRVTILDGDPRGPGTPLERALTDVVRAAAARGDACEWLRLRELRLHQCVGCFDCWVKTPGRCRLRDDGARIVAAVAPADLLVLAAPLRMGFTSALLKRGTERVLPVLLPYIDLVDGECHHRPRYGHPMDLALVVERGDATDDELAATEQVYRRLAKNVGGRLAWVRRISSDDMEARHALDAA